MGVLTILVSFARLVSGAWSNTNMEKLPEAMIASGLFKPVTVLYLIICKAPEGILHHHCMAPSILYYISIVAVAIFGIFEASAGFWVLDDLVGRRASGKRILRCSIGPLILVVAALQAFATLKVK